MLAELVMSDDNEHVLLTDGVLARRSPRLASERHQLLMVIVRTMQAHFAVFAHWVWSVWPWNLRVPVHGSSLAIHQYYLCLAVMTEGRMMTAS